MKVYDTWTPIQKANKSKQMRTKHNNFKRFFFYSTHTQQLMYFPSRGTEHTNSTISLITEFSNSRFCIKCINCFEINSLSQKRNFWLVCLWEFHNKNLHLTSWNKGLSDWKKYQKFYYGFGTCISKRLWIFNNWF